MSDYYVVESDSLSSVADAIREKTGKNEQLEFPDDFIDEIEGIQGTLQNEKTVTPTWYEQKILPSSGYDGLSSVTVEKTPGIQVEIDQRYEDEWVRPLTWPDLDTLDLTNFDGVYLTYDLAKTEGYGWIGVYADTNPRTSFYVQRGHLLNGQFVIDESNTVTSNTYFRQSLDNSYGTIQLWRVVADDPIVRFGFCTDKTSGEIMCSGMQPCVEKIGRLSNLTTWVIAASINTQTTGISWGTIWLQHEDIRDVTKITSMSYAWSGCVNLKKLELNGWNGSSVTSLTQAWYQCRLLKYIPIKNLGIATALNDIGGMCEECSSLISFDMSKWTVDPTKTFSVSFVFRHCQSLKEIKLPETGIKFGPMFQFCYNCCNLSEFDFSKIDATAITTMQNAFSNCQNIKEVSFKNWVFSNCTTLQSCFSNCRQLEIVDFTNCDFQNIIYMSGLFESCNNLKEIKLDGIKCDHVISFGSTFRNCFMLKEIDLSNFNVQDVTDMSNMFGEDVSLKIIDTTGWEFGENNIINFNATFSGCLSLSEIIGIEDWVVYKSNNLNFTFGSCRSLRSLDLSNWKLEVVSGSVQGMFQDANSLQYLDLSGFDTSALTQNTSITFSMNPTYINLDGWDLTHLGSLSIPNSSQIEKYWPPIIAVNHSYNQMRKLSIDSLLRIINSLPTVSSKTITLSSFSKAKLTDAQIAIATQKGWTVA